MVGFQSHWRQKFLNLLWTPLAYQQRMQVLAKNAKIYLKPTDFLKRNFYFETEGVLNKRKLDNKQEPCKLDNK